MLKSIFFIYTLFILATILNAVEFPDTLNKKDLQSECKKDIFTCAFTINYNTDISHNVYSEYSESSFTNKIPSHNIYSPGIKVKVMLPNMVSDAEKLKQKNNDISFAMTQYIETKHLLLFALEAKIFEQEKYTNLLKNELEMMIVSDRYSIDKQGGVVESTQIVFSHENSKNIKNIIKNTFGER